MFVQLFKENATGNGYWGSVVVYRVITSLFSQRRARNCENDMMINWVIFLLFIVTSTLRNLKINFTW